MLRPMLGGMLPLNSLSFRAVAQLDWNFPFQHVVTKSEMLQSEQMINLLWNLARQAVVSKVDEPKKGNMVPCKSEPSRFKAATL
ncbi:hypothetical protein L3X38_014430 [Prunus dulcis]|uniref:Uncharacterized protein n=1 Tax=Prunus dulcis TaxID=3755 RepID=A0AAD4ZIA6_PRUDU|nr:hypothetical protein L3X38_014430 [Prunus dulcis]